MTKRDYLRLGLKPQALFLVGQPQGRRVTAATMARSLRAIHLEEPFSTWVATLMKLSIKLGMQIKAPASRGLNYDPGLIPS